MTIVSNIRNLRLKFPGTQSLMFNDLNIQVKQGEKVLLLGPSGSGKSTLLQVLSGLIPQSIEVPMKCDDKVVPQKWAFMFQDPDTQFCMPYVDEELAFVLENLQVPREEMPHRITTLLNYVGLNLETVHMPISEMSQGMKQRLAIASSLALEPEVLFLDEPTALLDPEGTELIWQTLKQAAQGKTIIVVEHKIEHVVDMIERIVLFNYEGDIIADGPKDTVLNDYQSELQQYGIWYPEVWEHYTQSASYETIVHARAAVASQSAITHRASHAAEPVETAIVPETRPIIKLEDLRGFRGKQVKIHMDQALLNPGEWVVVAGDNGAGKSTLLLALMQLIHTTGTYLLHDKSIDAYKGSLHDELAFVFQNPEFQFVTNTVYDELAHSLLIKKVNSDKVKSEVYSMARQFKLEAHLNTHPYQCSVGQKRRLSVASALMNEQPVLLLDEPTFGQDARNTFNILEKLEQWRARGAAIVMVSHDLSIVRYFATRVWHIEQGQIVADTSPDHYLKAYEPAHVKECVICN